MNYKKTIPILFILNIMILVLLLSYNNTLNKKYLEKTSSIELSNTDINTKIKKPEETEKNKLETNKEELKETGENKDKNGKPIYINEDKNIILVNPDELTHVKYSEDKDINYDEYKKITTGIYGLFNYNSDKELANNIKENLDERMVGMFLPGYEYEYEDTYEENKNNNRKVNGMRMFIEPGLASNYKTTTYVNDNEDLIYLKANFKVYNEKISLGEPLIFGKIGEKYD